jgi:starch synthase (maltosyl-transferring)
VSRARVVIEGVTPQVDCGRFAVKRVQGDTVTVEATVYADGHDLVKCALAYRHERASKWQRTPMVALATDRWRGRFRVAELGRYQYAVIGWVDHLETWKRDLAKKEAAGQDTRIDQMRGAELRRAGIDRETIVRQRPAVVIEVERPRAQFSSWYEMFPRSAARQPGAHGSFADCEARLPYIAAMGFDVLYLPPIHPIGHTERKGANNRLDAADGAVGSPWAIGAPSGGHRAIHPQLGTLEDFASLLRKARELGIEIALDIAFQCSPDHPYVQEHPEWFLRRPDGSIQYAENPPKKYQDIFPFYFETKQWQELWTELKGVVDYWIAQGVRIFRVDNPHTKPLAFWEWLIAEVRRQQPEVIFLSEAFTRPTVMYRLAKLGFSQSYTYFTWRNTKYELEQYFRELSAPPVADFFRANLWPNTPDILPEYLQFGGRPAFMARLVLAATLGANYGIYGPAFELIEREPREPGSEEYLDSEKYQIRHWDLERADSLRDFIARVNRIRRDHAPLQSDRRLHFHRVDNEALISYSKTSEDGSESVLMVVNLDPQHAQSGWLELDLEALGLPADRVFQVHDLLSDARFLWQGPRNYVALEPQSVPAHIFRIRQRVRTEQDFDYFL